MANKVLRPGDGRRIVHLSDFHLGTRTTAQLYLTQLETDLRQAQKVSKVDYLVVSGDFADKATTEEFEAALHFVKEFARRFKVKEGRIITTPGNHDLNRDASTSAYSYVAPHQKPASLTSEYVDQGAHGALRREEVKYRQRFANFATILYAGLTGKPYPLDPTEQGILHEFPEDRLAFVTPNSCWEIDHLHPKRASINPTALSRVVDQVNSLPSDGWTKFLIFHHAVTTTEAMADGILEMPAVQGFKVASTATSTKRSGPHTSMTSAAASTSLGPARLEHRRSSKWRESHSSTTS